MINKDMVVEFGRWTSLGEELLKAFHDENTKYKNYKVSFEELKKTLMSRASQRGFLRNLGGTVYNSGTSKSDAIKAMKNLANQARGQVPSRNADFIQAIVDQTAKFNFVDAVSFTVVESAKDIGRGVQSVGNTLITTGKILNFIFIPVFFIVLYLLLKKKVA